MIQSLNCLRFLACLNHLISEIKRTTKDCLCDFFPQSAQPFNISGTSPTFFPFSSSKFWSQMTTFRKFSGGILRCNCFSYINLLVHLCEANVKVKSVCFYLMSNLDKSIGGYRAARDARLLPLGPFSFNFMRSAEKMAKITWVVARTPPHPTPPPTPAFQFGAAPSGKSWIRRHCRELNVGGEKPKIGN